LAFSSAVRCKQWKIEREFSQECVYGVGCKYFHFLPKFPPPKKKNQIRKTPRALTRKLAASSGIKMLRDWIRGFDIYTEKKEKTLIFNM
jgi:hypothetical protein